MTKFVVQGCSFSSWRSRFNSWRRRKPRCLRWCPERRRSKWTMNRTLAAAIFTVATTVFLFDSPVMALDGQIGIHDPSTILFCDGKYYTYGTGGTSLVSEDGWMWRRGTPLPRRG